MKHFGMLVYQEIVSLLNVGIRRKTKRGGETKWGYARRVSGRR